MVISPLGQHHVSDVMIRVLSQVIDFDGGSGSVLRIEPLRTHRDEAIYECTATNSVGEINTSAKLNVLEGKLLLLPLPHLFPSRFYTQTKLQRSHPLAFC